MVASAAGVLARQLALRAVHWATPPLGQQVGSCRCAGRAGVFHCYALSWHAARIRRADGHEVQIETFGLDVLGFQATSKIQSASQQCEFTA